MLRACPVAPALLALVLALACADDSSTSEPDASAPAAATTAASADEPAAVSAGSPPPRPAYERPLPAFSGRDFDGKRVDVSDFLGQRLLLYFFDASNPTSGPSAEAVADVSRLQGENNFRILGVASGADTASARSFAREHGLEFTIINDAGGRIARQLGLRIPSAFLFVDPEGYVTAAIGGSLEDKDAARVLEGALRERLRLPGAGPTLVEPLLGEHPLAPSFVAGRLGGGKPFDFASTRGHPVILVFFLHTCPHCHAALHFLKGALEALPEKSRPELIGISVGSASATTIRDTLRREGLDYFPVLVDPDGQVRDRYASLGAVPDILLIDARGRITVRVRGWRDERDPPLMRMRLAKLAGQPVPMLLHKTGYSGSEFCAVCHADETTTWELTQHAHAFDTLVKHAVERDPKCVTCHVVAYGKPGGYSFMPPTPYLEDVGCESCHGRGGPHLSPGFVKGHDYSGVCVTCHDKEHSLGFEYAAFLPRISHAANRPLLALSLEQKLARLEALGQPRPPALGTGTYVGSSACKSCHPAEYATWEASPHARAFRTLAAKHKAGDADCQKCHTTGFAKTGGFPAGGTAADHPGLVGVGCESCHGPGSAHVAPDAPKRGTILSLGDKCDSCVILQICGSCHDEANDPGFQFEVVKKIDAQRHGTIEPGTGRPKNAPQALLDAPPALALGLAGHAFEQLDAAAGG